MKQISLYIALLAVLGRPTLAADLQPLMTMPGKVLLSEDFSSDMMPRAFRTLQSRDFFHIVDGALEATTKVGQERATHGAWMVGGHDLTTAFSVKFTKSGSLFIGIDGYKEEFQGNTHLVRFSLTTERMAWDQKLGGPESKHAVSEANKVARAAKQPIPQPTSQQLADPKFFRTEELAAQEIHCPTGQWHDVMLEVNGNELVAQVDGQTLVAMASVADAKKNRVGIGLTGRGTVLIDNLRIRENQRRPDWEQIKTNLAASPKGKTNDGAK